MDISFRSGHAACELFSDVHPERMGNRIFLRACLALCAHACDVQDDVQEEQFVEAKMEYRFWTSRRFLWQSMRLERIMTEKMSVRIL